jgi:hypothetical protein
MLDLIALPLTLISALWLRFFRIGRNSMLLPLTKAALLKVGIFPLKDHYYEPAFTFSYLRKPFDLDRTLPGIDLNIRGALELLQKFDYRDELLAIPVDKIDGINSYYYNNDAFAFGDGDYLYNIIRHFKPGKIVEIGSGFSTLMAAKALRRNAEDTPDSVSRHICIEPYECAWLSRYKGVEVSRRKAEDIDPEFFRSLEENDILFIDSSHVIRPQGDLLYEVLEVLPILKRGVLIHFHDIFTPKDYPREWIVDQNKFWNEQYFLEAFLSHNRDFKVLAPLNHLKHRYFRDLAGTCPSLERRPEAEPGSFWIMKTA